MDRRTEPIYEDLGLGCAIPAQCPPRHFSSTTCGSCTAGAHRSAHNALTRPGGGPPRPRPARGPWTNRCASTGAPGAWDGGGAVTSAVVATPDGFLLWYEGYPEQPGPESIGLATSRDGVTFTKDADPVIAAGACGTAPDAAVFQPNVLATDDGYVMLFGGLEEAGGRTQVFGATSPDGRVDVRRRRSVTGLEQFSGSNYVHTFQAFDRDGQPAALFEILRGTTRSSGSAKSSRADRIG